METDEVEQRVRQLRTRAWIPLAVLAAMVVATIPRYAAEGWGRVATLTVVCILADLAAIRTADRHGNVLIHHPAAALLAAGVVVGVDPLVAATLVVVSTLITVAAGSPDRLRSSVTDWQRRTKVTWTAGCSSLAAITASLVVAAVAPAVGATDHPAIAWSAGALYGLVTGICVAGLIVWSRSGRLLGPDWRAVRAPLLAATPLASGGVVIGLLWTRVHPTAALFALAAVAPVVLALRRIAQLVEEQRHVRGLLRFAGTLSAGTLQEGRAQVAAAAAGLLGYRMGELRDEPPRVPEEIGGRLPDGSWLVLSGPERLQMADREDQRCVDGLAQLVSPLVHAAQRQAAMAHRAHTDALTGVWNRVGLLHVLAGYPAQSAIGVVYLDLDAFKPVNDEHGHDAGDTVLAEVGRRLAGQARGDDVAARVGGDEFVLVLAGVADPATARDAAQRAAERIARPVWLADGATVTVGCTFGVAIGTACQAEEVMRLADRSMLATKPAALRNRSEA